MRHADDGHLQVLEGILVTLILLGAAYTAVSFRLPAEQTSRARAGLAAVGEDTLTVMAHLVEDRGTVLDAGLSDATHCLEDHVSNEAICATNASLNLTTRISQYLPSGAGFAIVMDNGVRERELYRSTLPATEIASASYDDVPDWNLTFMAPELSCVDSAMDANFTMIAIRHGSVANLTYANATTLDGVTWTGTRSNALTNAWNVSILNATRTLSTSNVSANVTGKHGTYPGNSTYQTCSLGSAGYRLQAALRSSTFTFANATVPIGQNATLKANLSPIANAAGVTLLSANATIYEPLPPRPGEADAYAPVATVTFPSGSVPNATWSVPLDSIYGAHPVEVRALVQVNGVTLEAHLVNVLTAALPSGTTPVEAPYRVTLQAWFPDWR